MRYTHSTLYGRVAHHPMHNSQPRNYLLAKITLPRHTFLYNDEAHILRQLLSAPHEVIPFEQLADQFLEQFEYERDIRTLRRHISRLKRKLPSPLTIVSVREVGYALHDSSHGT